MEILNKKFVFGLLVVALAILLFSCQQDTNNGSNIIQKPKLGTRWIYRYSTYNSMGGFVSAETVVYKAVTMETLGGESWLKIIDSATNITIFYLNEKTGGLFQYIGNGSNLMCKYPASVNDSYRSLFNSIDSADYFVRSVNDILQLGVIPDVVVNYYGCSC